MAVEIIRDNAYRIIVLGQEDRVVYPNENESSLLAAVAEALAQTETKPSRPPTPSRKRGRPVKKKPVKEIENADS